MKTIIHILIIIAVCLVLQSLTMLPWWTFAIPCFFMGIYLGRQEANKMPFFTGFIAGFIVWAGATLFFHSRYGGNTLDVVAGLLKVQKPVAIFVIGLIGALITGLAVLSGYMLFKKEDKEGLNIKMKA